MITLIIASLALFLAVVALGLLIKDHGKAAVVSEAHKDVTQIASAISTLYEKASDEIAAHKDWIADRVQQVDELIRRPAPAPAVLVVNPAPIEAPQAAAAPVYPAADDAKPVPREWS